MKILPVGALCAQHLSWGSWCRGSALPPFASPPAHLGCNGWDRGEAETIPAELELQGEKPPWQMSAGWTAGGEEGSYTCSCHPSQRQRTGKGVGLGWDDPNAA